MSGDAAPAVKMLAGDAQTGSANAGIGTIDEEAAPAHNTHPPSHRVWVLLLPTRGFQLELKEYFTQLIPTTNIRAQLLKMQNGGVMLLNSDSDHKDLLVPLPVSMTKVLRK